MAAEENIMLVDETLASTGDSDRKRKHPDDFVAPAGDSKDLTSLQASTPNQNVYPPTKKMKTGNRKGKYWTNVESVTDEAILGLFTKKTCRKIAERAGIKIAKQAGAVPPHVHPSAFGQWRKEAIKPLAPALVELIRRSSLVAENSKRLTVKLDDVQMAMQDIEYKGETARWPTLPFDVKKNKKIFRPYVHWKPFRRFVSDAYGSFRPQESLARYLHSGACRIVYAEYQRIADDHEQISSSQSGETDEVVPVH